MVKRKAIIIPFFLPTIRIAFSSIYSPKCFQLGRRQKAYVFSTPEMVDATTHRFPERTSQMASSLVKLGMVSFCNREIMELQTFSHCFLLVTVVFEFKWNPCNGLNNTWTIMNLQTDYCNCVESSCLKGVKLPKSTEISPQQCQDLRNRWRFDIVANLATGHTFDRGVGAPWRWRAAAWRKAAKVYKALASHSDDLYWLECWNYLGPFWVLTDWCRMVFEFFMFACVGHFPFWRVAFVFVQPYV